MFFNPCQKQAIFRVEPGSMRNLVSLHKSAVLITAALYFHSSACYTLQQGDLMGGLDAGTSWRSTTPRSCAMWPRCPGVEMNWKGVWTICDPFRSTVARYRQLVVLGVLVAVI